MFAGKRLNSLKPTRSERGTELYALFLRARAGRRDHFANAAIAASRVASKLRIKNHRQAKFETRFW
jgi:hypothetical protein